MAPTPHDPGPVRRSLGARFAEAVARYPDGLAVIEGDTSQTYAEAAAHVQGLVDLLGRTGVDGTTPVAVAGGGTTGVWHAIMAAAVAGVPWVPLDDRQPPAVLADLVADSGARCCLGYSAAAEAAVGGVCEYLDGSAIPPAQWSGRCRQDEARPADTAYLIYTSGSTGRPKGVVIDQDAIAGFLDWMAAHERLTPADRVYQNHSIGFDNSIWEMFSPLAGGAALVLSDGSGPLAPIETIARAGVTVVNATARHAAALVDLAEAVGRTPFGTVRRLYVGAETVPALTAAKILDALPDGAYIANEYGPTEATITCTLGTITPELVARAGSGSMPIGWAIGDARIELRDSRGEPVPDGEPGELWVGGRCVARGYHNRPAETADRFVDDPWGDAPGSRWYRTGDQVLKSPDGYVFLGRDDAQVKVRGHRLEPTALEAAANRLPGVRQAAVVAVGGVTGAHDALWLFVVAPDGAEPAGIRATLAEQVEYFLVPDRVIVRTDPLPLTVNGKLDRDSLLASARGLRATRR